MTTNEGHSTGLLEWLTLQNVIRMCAHHLRWEWPLQQGYWRRKGHHYRRPNELKGQADSLWLDEYCGLQSGTQLHQPPHTGANHIRDISRRTLCCLLLQSLCMVTDNVDTRCAVLVFSGAWLMHYVQTILNRQSGFQLASLDFSSCHCARLDEVASSSDILPAIWL